MWMSHIENYFREFCREYGVDDSCYEFSLEKDAFRMEKTFLLKDASGFSKWKTIPIATQVLGISESNMNPFFRLNYSNPEQEQNGLKSIACALLLSLGTNNEVPSIEEQFGFFTYSCNTKKERDYKFLSLIDFESEESLRAGRFFLFSTMCVEDTKLLFASYPEEELFRRAAIVSKSIANSNRSLDNKLSAFTALTIRIDPFKAPLHFNQSKFFKDISPERLKEVEKLVCFLSYAKGDDLFGDYVVPEFSGTCSLNDDLYQALMNDIDLKKLSSKKIVDEVLFPATKTDIEKVVVPEASKFLCAMTIQDMSWKLQNAILEAHSEKTGERVPMVEAMANISKCFKIVEEDLDEATKNKICHDFSTLPALTQFVYKAISKIPSTCGENEHPLYVLAGMFAEYLPNHPTKKETFINIVFLALQSEEYHVFNKRGRTDYSVARALGNMRDKLGCNAATELLEQAILFHMNNPAAKKASFAEWELITEKAATLEDSPYEWIYGIVM